MKTFKPNSVVTSLLLASSLTLISACSSSDNESVNPTADSTTPNQPPSDDPDSTQPIDSEAPTQPITNRDPVDYGYVFTRGPGFESGQIERISLTDANTIDGMYPATTSDHRVTTDGESIYQIGRFNIDNLTKFSATDTSSIDYQLSVLGNVEGTSNPQALAFVDEDLAYLTRRRSDEILIIDPSPDEATSESLITGEISLAAYNRDNDGTLDLPDMTNAVIVDDKLFVLLENLDGFAPVNTGYVVVIDTNTNLEVDTRQESTFPLLGIELQTVNPTALHFNDTTGLLYVTGRGNFFNNESVPGDPYTGGIESINPTSFQTTLIIDDGEEDANNGFFTDAIVVNDTLGYAITLDGFDADFNSINNLRTFNPTTGEVSEPVEDTAGQSLTTLALGPDNHLWVGIQSNTPGFIRIDLATGVPAADRVATNLIPSNIVFIEAER
ncbi:MAG: hypothetical protein AB8B64_16035 [Granulosicoccus sp.]